MFAAQRCAYRRPASVSTVSTSNADEKRLVSLAPKPWRPPTVRFALRASSKFEPEKSEPITISGIHTPSPSCMRTGMPRPVLVTLVRPVSASIVTAISVVPFGSRCRLSSALTRISSKSL